MDPFVASKPEVHDELNVCLFVCWVQGLKTFSLATSVVLMGEFIYRLVCQTHSLTATNSSCLIDLALNYTVVPVKYRSLHRGQCSPVYIKSTE
jgi:hypothetical protein